MSVKKTDLISVLCIAVLLSAPLYTLAQNEEAEIPSQNNNPNPATETPTPTTTATLKPTTTITLKPDTTTTSNPDTTTTPNPDTTTTPNPDTTTTPNPDTTTTSKPTTSKPTTSKPTTSKPTTSKPTTSKPTTSKPTTPKPTTTAPKPTTTIPPPPEDHFPNNIGFWHSNSKNISCVIVKGAFELVVAVGDKNKINETIEIPESAKASGNCSENIQSLLLKWEVKSTNNETVYITNILELQFSLTAKHSQETDTEDSEKWYQLSRISFNQSESIKKDKGISFEYSAENLAYFETPVNKSYSCESNDLINVLDKDVFQFQLKMAHVQLEAFSKSPTSNIKFSPSQQCKADETPHKSKALLIGLTVSFSILLLAAGVGYFFWRRRRAQTGYQRLDDY